VTVFASLGWLCAACCGLCFNLHFCLTSSAVHILELYIFDNFTGGYWYSHNRNSWECGGRGLHWNWNWAPLHTVSADSKGWTGGECCLLVYFMVVTYLQVCVCACVLFCTLYLVMHSFPSCISHLLNFCSESARCTCVICCVWSMCVQIIISFSSPLNTRWL